MAEYRLEMIGVEKRFGATVALSGVDMAVRGGEVMALLGENGAGKSTLMKVLSGAHEPDAGTMRLDGAPYRPLSPLEARRAGVAMIYQELSLAPHLTVEQNIMLGMEPPRKFGVINGVEVRRRAVDALKQLEHPDIRPDARVGSLSVAAQQLVEVARAVAVGCRVLVLDEPTSSLTRGDVERLFALIARLKSQGIAIVYISHFIEECQRIADRYTVLRDGRTVGSGVMAGVTSDEIVRHMVGRQIEELYPRSPRNCGDVVLDVRGLAGRAKPQEATLEVRRGEVVGIAGLVGAGRTELLRTIFGLEPVKSGNVRVAAWSGSGTPSERWAQGAGMVSEDRKAEGLALNMTIGDNMTLTRQPRLVWPTWRTQMSQRWIERLGIKCRSDRQRVGDLSGGNQQKVAIARLLHHDVDVLLLDEPTRGIDVGSKAQIYQLIDDLAKAGKAVLMVSSYLPELLGVCDRIAVMCKGRLGRAHPVSEVTDHSLMLEATGQSSGGAA
jgi:ribose transport system ATP-binding protein